MNEAIITINGHELTQDQSRSVRSAIITFLSIIRDPKVTVGMERAVMGYHLNLGEVMAMIDATEVVMSVAASPMPEKELRETLEFIDVLARRVRSKP
jgi:hypothetical protein